MERKKILLAEVPEIVKAMESSFFHRAGFDFLLATDHDTAMQMVEEQDPVLIVLEARSENLDGVRFCREIKQDPFLRETHIVLIAPTGSREDVATCREGLCDAVVSRPLDGKKLVEVACDVLDIVDPAAPRKRVDLPMLCGPESDRMRAGNAHNINAGGVFIETVYLLPVDTIVFMEITLAKNSIRCMGRVAWVNHPEWLKSSVLPVGMGIQFTEINPEDARAIDQYSEPEGKTERLSLEKRP